MSKLKSIKNRAGKLKQGGFTFLELIAVVIIIGILAGSGLVYYEKALDDARRTGVEILAHRFTAAIALIHGQWILHGGYTKGKAGESSWVDVDNVRVQLNAFGWPANTDGGSAGIDDQTSEECYQVWQAVLQNPALTTVEGRANPDLEAANDPQAKGRQRYHISQLNGQICRYELITDADSSHLFDYNLHTGQVRISVPPLK